MRNLPYRDYLKAAVRDPGLWVAGFSLLWLFLMGVIALGVVA